MNRIDIAAEPTTALAEYARISIAFEVRTKLDVVGTAPPFTFVERAIEAPYVKDYDALDGGPTTWPERFDLAMWQLFVARADGKRVGGAAIAVEPTGSAMLCDVRVAPGARRRGIGAALFGAATRWARDRGCRRLEIETQDINVPACRFYEGRGCVLGRVRRGAYPEIPDEIQLVWVHDLVRSRRR